MRKEGTKNESVVDVVTSDRENGFVFLEMKYSWMGNSSYRTI